MPEQESPALHLLLLLGLGMPSALLGLLGVAPAEIVSGYTVGFVCLVVGAHLLVGVAGSSTIGALLVVIAGTPALSGLSAISSPVFAAAWAAVVTPALCLITRRMAPIGAAALTLVAGGLAMELLPGQSPIAPDVVGWSLPHWLAVSGALALGLFAPLSTGGVLERLQLRDGGEAALLAIPRERLALLTAALGGAVIGVGAAMLDHVGWSPALELQEGRIVTPIAVLALLLIAGPQSLTGLLLLSLPVVLLPAQLPLVVPDLMDLTLPLAGLGVALSAWMHRGAIQ